MGATAIAPTAVTEFGGPVATATLPRPSKAHATCAWCHTHFTTIVQLIDHVEAGHVSPASPSPSRVS